MKGMPLPAATFRGGGGGGGGGTSYQERGGNQDRHQHQEQQQQQQQDTEKPRHWPVYSLVMTALVMGLVVPVTERAHPVPGAVLAIIVAFVSIILVYRFVTNVRGATMTDWEYVRMPGALACLDVYLFVCLNWAMIWFVIWANDQEGALSSPVLTGDSAAHLVYLVILYNVLASFWFSGGGRLYPVSALAYAWGFLSLVIGAWLAILVVGWLVHIVRRSPSRVNENTLLPVYHTPYPVASSAVPSAAAKQTPLPSYAHNQQQQKQQSSSVQPPSAQEQEELRKTMARLAQAQKEQRMLQKKAAAAANKARTPLVPVSAPPIATEKNTKAKDI